MNGNNTKIHETIEYPDLHIMFNNHVQKSMYNIFIMKIRVTLEASQL